MGFLTRAERRIRNLCRASIPSPRGCACVCWWRGADRARAQIYAIARLMSARALGDLVARLAIRATVGSRFSPYPDGVYDAARLGIGFTLQVVGLPFGGLCPIVGME